MRAIPARRDHPQAQGRAIQLEALALKDRFQPVQRQKIGVFGGGDVGQHSRAGHALVDRGDVELIGPLDAGVEALVLAGAVPARRDTYIEYA